MQNHIKISSIGPAFCLMLFVMSLLISAGSLAHAQALPKRIDISLTSQARGYICKGDSLLRIVRSKVYFSSAGGTCGSTSVASDISKGNVFEIGKTLRATHHCVLKGGYSECSHSGVRTKMDNVTKYSYQLEVTNTATFKRGELKLTIKAHGSGWMQYQALGQSRKKKLPKVKSVTTYAISLDGKSCKVRKAHSKIDGESTNMMNRGATCRATY